tara:strand:- start:289 stop:528 length:240 start_codon:yes stop_codon:yes gene_type:complete
MSAYTQFKLPSEMTPEEKKQQSYKATAGAVIFFVKPLIVKYLWNWLIPGLFGFATLTYLQALVLCWLIKLLFDYTHELK